MRWRAVFFLGLGLLALSSMQCDYGGNSADSLPLTGFKTNSIEKQVVGGAGGAQPGQVNNPFERKTLLESVFKLVEKASESPGGEHFANAVDNLNQFFKLHVAPEQFEMAPRMRAFLLPRLREAGVKDLEAREFIKPDGRHLEDCLMYHLVAGRVGGSQGDELERVVRVFNWMVEQVELVPVGSLAPPPRQGERPVLQAQARPYDVLLRGMACEQGEHWAERSWLFMALCRQLGIDVGFLEYPMRAPAAPGQETMVPWICVAIVDGKAYLFDARLGIPIPGPDGKGVATLEEAATNPDILARLDLPGQSPYQTTFADIANAKLTVLVDSTPGYFKQRMRLLQDELSGRYRLILYRDPAEARENFAKALGDRFGGMELWSLPLEVEYRLFNDPNFVRATQFPIQLFDAKLPLLSARLDQLRGELNAAKEKYVKFRKAGIVLTVDKKEQVPAPLRHALDVYATHFLALCHLDQGRADQAEFMFGLALKDIPEPSPQDAYFYMFRWGALTNLARLSDAKGDTQRALAYYCAPIPTSQFHGNLLRAREIVWENPMADLPAPLPPAPVSPFALPQQPQPPAGPVAPAAKGQ